MCPHRPATKVGSRAGPPVSECVPPISSTEYFQETRLSLLWSLLWRPPSRGVGGTAQPRPPSGSASCPSRRSGPRRWIWMRRRRKRSVNNRKYFKKMKPGLFTYRVSSLNMCADTIQMRSESSLRIWPKWPFPGRIKTLFSSIKGCYKKLYESCLNKNYTNVLHFSFAWSLF